MEEERHDSRCSRCKSIIYSMLYEIYGNVQLKYKAIDISTRVENYKGTKLFKPLSSIFNKLVRINGYKDFVKSTYLQRCDFFIPSKKLIIETDEIQHFTYARYISLKNYPKELVVGFDRKWYMQKCNEVQNVDTDPIYRDEQRAWYDTIRDFLPLISNEVRLTIRIPLGFHPWCSLNQVNRKHIATFKNIALRGTK